MLWVALGILTTALILLVLNHESGTVGGMESNQFAHLIYGATLGLVIGSGVLFSYRNRLGEALRHGVTWLAAFAALITGYTFKDEFSLIAQRVMAEILPGSAVVQYDQNGLIIAELRRADGDHFGARAEVNGIDIPMLVDTGASEVVLSYDDARKAGVDMDRLFFNITVNTANGQTKSAPARLRHISVGGIRFYDFNAMVAQRDDLDESLLGISFLNRLESYEVKGNRLVLRGFPDRE